MNITQEGLQMAHKKIVPGTGGEHYIPYKDRSGEKPPYILQRIFPQRD